MRGYDIVIRYPPLNVYVAVLDDNSCISEDEVDCSVYVAVSVELAMGLREQGVLISIQEASVEY